MKNSVRYISVLLLFAGVAALSMMFTPGKQPANTTAAEQSQPPHIIRDYFDQPPEDNEVTCYEKRPTLSETMLATRDNYRNHWKQQHDALAQIRNVKVYVSPPVDADSEIAQQIASGKLDLNQRGTTGKEFWTKLDKPEDANYYQFAGNDGKKKTGYIACTFHSEKNITLRTALFGGNKLTLYCNGEKHFEKSYSMQFPEYWWQHEKRFVVEKRHRLHQSLTDVPVKKGQNVLLLKITQNEVGRIESFTVSFSMNPQTEEKLWEQLRHDFPEAQKVFLDKVPAGWFSGEKTDGWFAAEDSREMEKEFYQSLIEQSGLTKTNAPAPDNLRGLIALAHFAQVNESLEKLEKAAVELHHLYPAKYTFSKYKKEMESIKEEALQLAHSNNFEPSLPEGKAISERIESLKYEALVSGNPVLAGQKIIFAKHHTYAPFHYYDEYNNSLGQRFGNSNLCMLSLKTGKVTELLPDMRDGLFDRFDVSYDGKKIVFGYQKPTPGGMRIYEVNADGSGLRQLTSPPGDEAERMARYNIQPEENLSKDFTGYASGYGHWTDDMHPAYLPDGRITFTSTRSERSVLCGPHTLSINNLYRINSDGTGLHQLSQGALHEYAPSVLNDGRIIYNRWEYVDKGVGGSQPLWAMRPDGSATEEIYGNTITDPGVFIYGKAIPGRNDLVVCTGAAHEMLAVGPVLLIDRNKDKRDAEAMISITPEVSITGMRTRLFERNGKIERDIYGPVYCHPYPLTDPETHRGGGTFFLVSANDDGFLYDKTGFGIYLIDKFGNKVLLYDDPEVSCWQPELLAPRPVPPVIPDHTNFAHADEKATIFMSDVYNGLEEYGVNRGEVKYLRIWEYIPRPWTAFNPWGASGDKAKSDDYILGQMAVVSKHTRLWVQVLNGIVPVYPDGSAHFTVPADKMLFFQALDSNYQEVQRMRTYVSFEPGEKRSCIGCHENRKEAPRVSLPLAMLQEPNVPGPQPGETVPRPVHYTSDVQPVWDRHCIQCHSGNNPKAGLDLSGKLTTHFNQSYENLIDRELVSFIQEFVGPQKGGGSMSNIPAKPPKSTGSHASMVVEELKTGHHGVKLSPEEWIKVVTWIDSNNPYYGSYFGRRHIRYKDHPDFRPVPDVEMARGKIPGHMLNRLDELVYDLKEGDNK